jgi:hypothetical protein
MLGNIYNQKLITSGNIYEKSFLKSVKEYIEYDSTLYTLAFSCTQSRAISFRFKEIYTKYFDISVCKKYLFLARLLNIIDRKSIIVNKKFIIVSDCRVILSNSICSYRVYRFDELIKQDILASVESKKHNIQPVLVKL